MSRSRKSSLLALSALLVLGSFALPQPAAKATGIDRGDQLLNFFKGGVFDKGTAGFQWTDDVIAAGSPLDQQIGLNCQPGATTPWVFISAPGNERDQTKWVAQNQLVTNPNPSVVVGANLNISKLATGDTSAIKTNGGSWSLGVACNSGLNSAIDWVAFRSINVTAVTGEWSSVGSLVIRPISEHLYGNARAGYSLYGFSWACDIDVPVKFEWLRDGVVIPNAPYSEYVITHADATHNLSERTTCLSTDYGDATATTFESYVYPDEQSQTPTPEIAGEITTDTKVTVVPGIWGGFVTLAYQWKLDGRPIPSSTKSTYTITAANVGHSLTVDVTGSAFGFATVTKTSAASIVTKAAMPIFDVSLPSKVSASKAVSPKVVWLIPGVTTNVQWLVDGRAVSTAKTYKPTAKQKGHKLSVKVTVSKNGYLPNSITSKAVKIS